MQVQNAAIGIKTLLLKKSKKSRKLKPRSLILLHIPNPRDEGTAIIIAMTNMVMQALSRDK